MARFPGESDEYRAARDRLLQREVDLRRETEAVAAERGRPDWDEQLAYN